jgi:hypothetical protein
MSRATGRRSAARINTRRSAVLGIVVVGLTFGMLTLSGTTPLGIGRSVDNPSRVSLDQRIFSCTGGIAGTTISSGNVRNGDARTQAVGSVPITITAPRDVARGAFAGQQARAGKGFAWVPCPEARARWWFVGAGGAVVTHDTVLTLTNPRPGTAVVDVSVYGPEGLVESPGLKGVTVASGAVRTVDLAKAAPGVGNLAVSVIASRGLVAVSAADRISPGSVGSTVHEWLPPQSLPALESTLAGLVPSPGSASLIVVNPGRTDAIVKVELIGATGTFVPKALPPFTVGPQAVATLPATAVFDGSPVAVRISSNRPVTATVRSVKAGDLSMSTGVRAIRGGTAFAVPQGTGQVVLSSLRTGATIRVTAYDARGRSMGQHSVKVPPQSSVAVPISPKVRSVALVADRPDVVAGFWVDGVKGLASAGVVPAIRSVRLPQVRPGW